MPGRRPVLPKQARPAQEARQLTPEQERERLLMYAFRALGQRALSEAELRQRLLRRTGDPELAGSVLERVKELGYLSDDLVARVEAGRRGVGEHRVRQKLRQRGLEPELIEQAVADRDQEAELEDARQLLARRWPGFQRAPDPRRRAHAFLSRRGYPGAVIWQLLAELELGLPEDEEPKDMDEAAPD
ncbi:MAG: RecX family transcriptional regulator [Deinococcus sp.]